MGICRKVSVVHQLGLVWFGVCSAAFLCSISICGTSWSSAWGEKKETSLLGCVVEKLVYYWKWSAMRTTVNCDNCKHQACTELICLEPHVNTWSKSRLPSVVPCTLQWFGLFVLLRPASNICLTGCSHLVFALKLALVLCFIRQIESRFEMKTIYSIWPEIARSR